jgi:hypothetical protein
MFFFFLFFQDVNDCEILCKDVHDWIRSIGHLGRGNGDVREKILEKNMVGLSSLNF